MPALAIVVNNPLSLHVQLFTRSSPVDSMQFGMLRLHWLYPHKFGVLLEISIFRAFKRTLEVMGIGKSSIHQYGTHRTQANISIACTPVSIPKICMKINQNNSQYMKINQNNSQQLKSADTKKRRSEQSYDAILESTLTILAEKGYKALTIEGIAARARVSKQTIYRWWSSKAAIVLEALTNRAQKQLPIPDSGSVRGDLEVLLDATFRELSQQSGQIVRGLMAEAQFDSEFGRRFREDFIAQRREVLLCVLMRGQKRGEISHQVDLELIVDLLYGPMWYRLLNQHAPLNEDFARHLLDQLFAGLN